MKMRSMRDSVFEEEVKWVGTLCTSRSLLKICCHLPANGRAGTEEEDCGTGCVCARVCLCVRVRVRQARPHPGGHYRADSSGAAPAKTARAGGGPRIMFALWNVYRELLRAQILSSIKHQFLLPR